MSYPHNIVAYDLYYDPVQLGSDHELSYMLSFESLSTSEKSIHFSPRDTYDSPLETYGYIDFIKDTYDKMCQQSH